MEKTQKYRHDARTRSLTDRRRKNCQFLLCCYFFLPFLFACGLFVVLQMNGDLDQKKNAGSMSSVFIDTVTPSMLARSKQRSPFYEVTTRFRTVDDAWCPVALAASHGGGRGCRVCLPQRHSSTHTHTRTHSCKSYKRRKIHFYW